MNDPTYQYASRVQGANDSSELAQEDQQRVADILDDYLVSLEQGVPLDVESVLKENSDIADTLREYLDGLISLYRNCAGMDANDSSDSTSTVPVAKKLGDYELLREIGRGGMGIVYEAKQISLSRQVALKVLPFGAMLDEKQIARFENEARAAAQLHHPHIVPIFDVGADRDVHFYAMQLITGQSLRQVIEQMRQRVGMDTEVSSSAALATRSLKSKDDRLAEAERSHSSDPTIVLRQFPDVIDFPSNESIDYVHGIVQLMIQAADALQAAHEYGIIHRDVKPSNFMIDGHGQLWVTDFGLARFQSDHSVTRSGDVLGTLHYMSPEQASGRIVIDHRTDVYSLGVTIYELLTLRRPFDGDSQHEIVGLIEQGHFLRPRHFNSKISSDLENVIQKAMAVDRDDRYRSASELADDLRRFLEGRPTQAKKPGIAQRVAKWTQRHQFGVLVSCVVLMILVIGLGLSTILVARANEQTRSAYAESKTNLSLAQDAIDLFVEDVDRALEARPDSQQIRGKLLRRSLDYYQAIVDKYDDVSEFRADKAVALTKLADLHAKLGQLKDAERGFLDAERLFSRLASEHAKWRADRIRCWNNLADVQHRLGKSGQAESTLLHAMAWGSQFAKDDSQIAVALAESWNGLGTMRSELGRVAEAIKAFENGLQLFHLSETGSVSDGPDAVKIQASIHNNLWQAHRSQDAQAARRHIEHAVTFAKQLVKMNPGDTSADSMLATAYSNLGVAANDVDDDQKAREALTAAVNLQRRLVAREPHAIAFRSELAATLNSLAKLHLKHKQFRLAESIYREAIDIYSQLVRDVPQDLLYQSRLGGLQNNLGVLLRRSGRADEALTEFERAVGHLAPAFSKAPQVPALRDTLSRTYFNYAQTLNSMGKGDRAAEITLQRRELWPDEPHQLVAVVQELAIALRSVPPALRPAIDREMAETIRMATSSQRWSRKHLDELKKIAATYKISALENQLIQVKLDSAASRNSTVSKTETGR